MSSAASAASSVHGQHQFPQIALSFQTDQTCFQYPNKIKMSFHVFKRHSGAVAAQRKVECAQEIQDSTNREGKEPQTFLHIEPAPLTPNTTKLNKPTATHRHQHLMRQEQEEKAARDRAIREAPSKVAALFAEMAVKRRTSLKRRASEEPAACVPKRRCFDMASKEDEEIISIFAEEVPTTLTGDDLLAQDLELSDSDSEEELDIEV